MDESHSPNADVRPRSPTLGPRHIGKVNWIGVQTPIQFTLPMMRGPMTRAAWSVGGEWLSSIGR